MVRKFSGETSRTSWPCARSTFVVCRSVCAQPLICSNVSEAISTRRGLPSSSGKARPASTSNASFRALRMRTSGLARSERDAERDLEIRAHVVRSEQVTVERRPEHECDPTAQSLAKWVIVEMGVAAEQPARGLPEDANRAEHARREPERGEMALDRAARGFTALRGADDLEHPLVRILVA